MIDEHITASHLYRLLPSMDEVLRRPEFVRLIDLHSRAAVFQAARVELVRARAEVARGVHTAETLQIFLDGMVELVARAVEHAARATIVSVLNATGVILHTNLGRAPLSEAAIQAVVEVGSGYSNLEFNLESGEREHRDQHVCQTILRVFSSMTGKPTDALSLQWSSALVNNCAAATFLALNSLAEGGEVIVSRGELVEIGGGFRIPDILRKSGALLREVGTTNRTRLSDYAGAVNANTKLILRVHQSNFRMEGYTERPDFLALIDLARRANVPIFEDQGTGSLVSLEDAGVREESSLLDSFLKSPDLIACSGDKLLGGPQCGLLLGRPELLRKISSNPLSRAFRVDKLTYAAFAATLNSYASERDELIPTVRMLRLPEADVRIRCEALRPMIGMDALEVLVVPVKSVIGGGTAPGAAVNSFAISLRLKNRTATRLLAALRHQRPPVVGRVKDGCVLLDLRTVPPEYDGLLGEAICNAAKEECQ